MTQVPAHVLAQFDEMVLAFEPGMHTRMLKGHQ